MYVIYERVELKKQMVRFGLLSLAKGISTETKWIVYIRLDSVFARVCVCLCGVVCE